MIRVLTADDPAQTAAARSLLSHTSIWIAKTVMLEADWVLRKVYQFDERAVAVALKTLLGLRNVHVEHASAVEDALALTAHGIEFADALHLSSRPLGCGFVTFDKTCVRRAARAGMVGVSLVPAAM